MLRFESHHGGRSLIWLFGTGTIGGEIRNSLASATRLDSRLSVEWDHRPALTMQLRKAFDVDLSSLEGPPQVIWAAGVAGFSASIDQAQNELATFRLFLGALQNLAEISGSPVRFHLVSSAGGLFEGRSINDTGATPSPSRPYGEMKLAQEHLTFNSPFLDAIVYRPSSVFAAPNRANRPSLIGVVVDAAWRKQPATITGDPSTLRDYVSAKDVGTHIARSTIGFEANDRLQYLVAGSATSISLVVRTIEIVTRRRVMVEYADAWNSSNITFAPGLRATTFRTDSLAVGIRQVYEAVRW